jgi:xanthine/uracil permease
MLSMQPAPPQLDLRYGLDAWPPPLATAVLSLQWLVVLLPGLLVLGEVVALAQGLDPAGRAAFLQRLLIMGGLVQMAQVWWGHRLPGLVGPSAVLMVGMLATLAGGLAAVNGAMLLGGALTALLGLSGLAGRLGRLYTPPVLSSTLLLIAVSLAPTLRDLFFPPAAVGAAMAGPFLFAMALVAAMLWAQHRLKGLVSSSVLLVGMLLGSAAYYLLGLGSPSLPVPGGLAAWSLPDLRPLAWRLDPGVVTAFVLCYLALTANELATVESLAPMVGADDPGGRPARLGRSTRAVLVSGLGGMLSGLWGLPGPVTYSVSPGVLIASRSASRWTLLPASLMLLLLALWPGGLALVSLMPGPVVGAVLFCLMASTVYAALMLLTRGGCPLEWPAGLVVGTALTGGMVVTFMPAAARQALHPLLQPLLANGFVVGLLLALVVEHLVLRAKSHRI